MQSGVDLQTGQNKVQASGFTCTVQSILQNVKYEPLGVWFSEKLYALRLNLVDLVLSELLC